MPFIIVLAALAVILPTPNSSMTCLSVSTRSPMANVPA